MLDQHKLEYSLKKHERDVLMYLYQEHAKYLARIVKTLVEKKKLKLMKFLEGCDYWQSVATCHEIAINNSQSFIKIETHQNHRGKEREYTNHPKAKNISRNKRVQIIWGLLYDLLVNHYETLDVYSDLKKETKDHILCPFCHENLFTQEEILVSIHRDGTENFQYKWIFESGLHEYHMMHDGILFLINDSDTYIYSFEEHFDTTCYDLLVKSKLEFHEVPAVVCQIQQNWQGVYFVDLSDFNEFLQEFFDNNYKYNENCTCNFCEEIREKDD